MYEFQIKNKSKIKSKIYKVQIFLLEFIFTKSLRSLILFTPNFLTLVIFFKDLLYFIRFNEHLMSIQFLEK